MGIGPGGRDRGRQKRRGCPVCPGLGPGIVAVGGLCCARREPGPTNSSHGRTPRKLTVQRRSNPVGATTERLFPQTYISCTLALHCRPYVRRPDGPMVEHRIRGHEQGLSMVSTGSTERLVSDIATGESGFRASTTATDRRVSRARCRSSRLKRVTDSVTRSKVALTASAGPPRLRRSPGDSGRRALEGRMPRGVATRDARAKREEPLDVASDRSPQGTREPPRPRVRR